jgi:hypothetical protein
VTNQESQIESVNSKLSEIEEEFSDLTKKKIDLLQAKISALDELLQERDRAISEVRVLQELLKSSEYTSNKPSPPASTPNVVSGEFAGMPVWKGVRAILMRERRPLRTGEIVARLLAGGKKLSSRNPSSQVHTSIRPKTGVFYSKKKASKSVWGLVEWKEQQDKEASG